MPYLKLVDHDKTHNTIRICGDFSVTVNTQQNNPKYETTCCTSYQYQCSQIGYKWNKYSNAIEKFLNGNIVEQISTCPTVATTKTSNSEGGHVSDWNERHTLD